MNILSNKREKPFNCSFTSIFYLTGDKINDLSNKGYINQ